jgi:hypothetical protein
MHNGCQHELLHWQEMHIGCQSALAAMCLGSRNVSYVKQNRGIMPHLLLTHAPPTSRCCHGRHGSRCHASAESKSIWLKCGTQEVNLTAQKKDFR